MDTKCDRTSNQQGPNGSESSSLICDFRRLLEDMAAFARERDIKIVPYQSSSLPHFSALPARQQKSVYKGLKAYYETMILTHGKNRLPLAKSVEHMLEKLECEYDRDYLGLLTDQHVIEIYSVENLQAYRNIDFFTLTAYPLEEMCTRAWFDLWERDSRITELLLKLVSQASDFTITGTITVLMPAHEVRDQVARLKTGQLLSPMMFAPLYDKHGAIYGYVTSYKVNAVE